MTKNEKKRERGRPPKTPEDKRSEVLYLKLTPAEKELICNVSPEPSVWARGLVLAAAEKLSRKKHGPSQH